jgi:RNA polymerase sigma-70 factor (ECF subfamily)
MAGRAGKPADRQSTGSRSKVFSQVAGEETVLARARQGDSRALGELLQPCLPPLHRLARTYGHAALGAAEPEDLVQDTVVVALRRLHAIDVDEPGALLAYMRRVLVNRIRDLVRARRRRPMVEELGDEVASLAPSPLDRALGRERGRRLKDALVALPPADRQLIGLRLRSCGYDEMATRLGRPSPNAVRVATARAVSRLAAGLAGARLAEGA